MNPKTELTTKNLAVHTKKNKDKHIEDLEQQLEILELLFHTTKGSSKKVQDVRDKIQTEFSEIETELKEFKKHHSVKKYVEDDSYKPTAMIRKGPHWPQTLRTTSTVLEKDKKKKPLRTRSDPVTSKEGKMQSPRFDKATSYFEDPGGHRYGLINVGGGKKRRETTTTAPTLLRSKSDEIPREEKTAPRALRRSSDPTTTDEILDKQNICFKGGEEITFILTHRSWFTHGIHLGIKVIQDGNAFTLGFSPNKRGTGLFKPVDAAIYIPDVKVENALKTGTATILNNKPFILSKNAAARLNDYTCNGTPGEKVTFKMAGLSAKDREEWGDQIVFVKKFIPKNIKYKFAFNDDKCTNCQGFLSTIFSDDKDVIEKIIPYLQAWASTEVAEKAQALRDAKPRKTYLDHFEKNTYLGLGGRKSHKKSRKPKKKHRRRRTRKRKRKKKKPKENA